MLPPIHPGTKLEDRKKLKEDLAVA